MQVTTSQALAPLLASLERARTHQALNLKLLKDSIDLQGQLALQLLPQPPRVDPSAAIGRHIDLYV